MEDTETVHTVSLLPLSNGFSVVVTASAGLASFSQALLHCLCWAVKEQHLQSNNICSTKPDIIVCFQFKTDPALQERGLFNQG